MKRILEESPVVGYQLFRHEGRRADGTPIVYPNYHIRKPNGKYVNTKTDKLALAKTAVKKLAGEAAQVEKRHSRGEACVNELLDLILEDYKQGNKRSIDTVRGEIKNSLRPFFGDMLANHVGSDDIDRFVRWRTEHPFKGSGTVKPGLINRDLAILRRAFQLGFERKPALVDRVPPIKKLPLNNTRKGFITPDQYRALIAALPEHLRGITCVAYHVANRRSELFNLEWSDVELDGNPPILTLWPGETKNKDGRTLPLLKGEMLDTLQRLRAERDAKWPGTTHVFLNEHGKPLLPSSIRKAWRSACTRAGVPGLLFHDLRRSGVRNLRRAGVTETVAMAFSGHKTASVFSRYNITDFDDLRDAADKLGNYLKQS